MNTDKEIDCDAIVVLSDYDTYDELDGCFVIVLSSEAREKIDNGSGFNEIDSGEYIEEVSLFDMFECWKKYGEQFRGDK